jgi:pyridoxal phosphate enzyme (YggS family)
VQVKENLAAIEARIHAACVRSQRDRSDVQVIAVTKYATLERTQEVVESGCTQLGESRAQDAAKKWTIIGEQATWHFIGHLQTNKVKDVLGKFAWIHSLDRSSLAEELERKAAQLDMPIDCLVQVNVSGEESKYGLAPDAFESFMDELVGMPHIRVRGLMTMAPYESDAEHTRAVFRGLRELRDAWNVKHPEQPLTELSMGMSNDFEVAIEEGATMIRLGTILVG